MHLLANMGLVVKQTASLPVKDQVFSIQQASEAREIFFKFASPNENRKTGGCNELLKQCLQNLTLLFCSHDWFF